MLNITIEELDETVILHCTGKIVRGHETALLCAARGHYGRSIVLDVTEVDTIDAAGVGALISLQAAGIYFKLMNPNKAIREVLRVTRLDSIVEICGSPAAEGYKDDARQMPSTEPIPLRLVAIARDASQRVIQRR